MRRYRARTGSAYTLADSDEGKAISVKVSFTDDAGNDESLTSAATDAVAAAADPHAPQEAQAANSPATGAPAITGAARVGETLTVDTSGIADEDGLENAVFSYQWLAGGADISGATDSTYVPVVDDAGRAIGVRVSFTDDAGFEETLSGAAVAVPADDYTVNEIWEDGNWGRVTVGGLRHRRDRKARRPRLLRRQPEPGPDLPHRRGGPRRRGRPGTGPAVRRVRLRRGPSNAPAPTTTLG